MLLEVKMQESSQGSSQNIRSSIQESQQRTGNVNTEQQFSLDEENKDSDDIDEDPCIELIEEEEGDLPSESLDITKEDLALGLETNGSRTRKKKSIYESLVPSKTHTDESDASFLQFAQQEDQLQTQLLNDTGQMRWQQQQQQLGQKNQKGLDKLRQNLSQFEQEKRQHDSQTSLSQSRSKNALDKT
eukprot:TRINITY_DN1645_c0_g1_i4.p1 TRINITY_DN1645_c0_g1~~TRINITY_DN1645_c0_g1_i4.p1  ORF type:complete len:187 (+),score=1.27 TRINITY_DN1645_c0_g1_i4:442-1002(+)